MENIKKFIEEFTNLEAEMINRRRVPDYLAHNKSVDTLRTYIVEALYTMMNDVMLEKNKNKKYYELTKNSNPVIPRHLFKISHYTNSKYGDVWVAYVSSKQPTEELKSLKNALLIIKEKEILKIAKLYIYSDYESDGLHYQWNESHGITELTFESLIGPDTIERYQEPYDKWDGIKLYNDNI